MCYETTSHPQVVPLSEEEVELILDHRKKKAAQAGWLRRCLLRSMACIWAILIVAIWFQAHSLQQSGGLLTDAPAPLSWLILLIH